MPRPRVRRFRACKRKRTLWKNFRVNRKVGGDPVNGVDRDGRYWGESWVRKGKNFVSDNSVGLAYAYFTGDYGGAIGVQKGHNVAKAQGYSVGSADYFKTVGAAWGIQSTANLVGVAVGQFCATCGIVASSTISSVGDSWLLPGSQDISTSFGAFSVNWSSGDVGYLGEYGNSWQENLGYGLGALANLGDAAKLVGQFSSLNDRMPIGESSEDQIVDANKLNRGVNDSWDGRFNQLNVDGNQNEIYALIEKHGQNLDAAEAEYWQAHGTWFQRNISNPTIRFFEDYFGQGHVQSFRAENGLHMTKELWNAKLIYGHLDRISAYSFGGLGSIAHGYLEVTTVQRFMDMTIYGGWRTSY